MVEDHPGIAECIWGDLGFYEQFFLLEILDGAIFKKLFEVPCHIIGNTAIDFAVPFKEPAVGIDIG